MRGLFKAKSSSQPGKTLYFELEQGTVLGRRGSVFSMKITALEGGCNCSSNGLGPRGTKLVRKEPVPKRFMRGMPVGKLGYYGWSSDGIRGTAINSTDMYAQDIRNLRTYLGTIAKVELAKKGVLVKEKYSTGLLSGSVEQIKVNVAYLSFRIKELWRLASSPLSE